MDIFNNKIESNQSFRGINYNFDADSSPKAWEHYNKVYTKEHWNGINCYNVNNPSFFEYIRNGYYVNEPLSYYNSLFALPKELVESTDLNGNKYYQACLKLRGETDFNFNQYKYPVFKKILFTAYIDKKIDKDKLEENFKNLDYCNNMHHNLLNFSLIQSSGNMQGYKSKGVLLSRNKYEYLDRLDSFVFLLDAYYKLDEKARKTAEIIKNAGEYNNANLENYLNSFSCIFDYCKKIYFIDNKDFINKLIKNGEKPINNADDVHRYIEFAKEYWDIKKKIFEEIYSKNQ